jgi:hypothetical protein
LNVTYTITGTATNGTDYTPTLTGTAAIPIGSSSVDVTITPVDDPIFEGSETVILTLTDTATYDLGTAGTETATVVIADNDFALAIVATDADKLEGNTGNTPFTFTVTRTGDTSTAVTTNWTVTGGVTNPANAADFGGTLPTGTVSFGVGETTKDITVNVSGDTVGELDENFTVTLSNPSIPATITTATAAGSIRNDDGGLLITPINAVQTEGNSGIKAFTFRIDRLGNTSGTTDLKWTVTGSGANPANAADFDSGILPVGKVRFLPGETSKLISVNVRGDITQELDETFSVAITAFTGGSAPVTIGTGTIVNDDGVAASRTAVIRSAVILGTAGNDTLLGTAGNEVLLGVDPLNGAGTGEIDRLTGGEGSDSLRDAYRRFVLADANNTYYLGNGISDHALITDFGATDTIQARIGSALTIGGILPTGILGTALYLNTDLVAVVQGTLPTAASFVSV